jgi:hypothetical protein
MDTIVGPVVFAGSWNFDGGLRTGSAADALLTATSRGSDREDCCHTWVDCELSRQKAGQREGTLLV